MYKYPTQHKKKTAAGFTLVEILVYVALFAIISMAVVQTLVVMMRTGSAAAINHSLQESGYGALERITRLIRAAESIDISASVLDSDNGSLTLVSYDSSNNKVTEKLYVSNSFYLNNWSPSLNRRALQRDANGALTGPLTDRNIEVNSLVFRRIPLPAGEAVKIEMTITDVRGQVPKTEHFYNTVILRGAY